MVLPIFIEHTQQIPLVLVMVRGKALLQQHHHIQ
jgi:hypothetical protein